MSGSTAVSFGDALVRFQKRLTRALGQSCRIEVKRGLDEETIGRILEIDSAAFRPELRYSRHEFALRGNEGGLLLLIVECAGLPVAFFLGYRDPSEEDTFFMDTLATLIEGRGLGSALIALALLHGLEEGYRLATLRTEERDEKGRALRRFYEGLGFETFPCEPSEGVGMRMRLERGAVAATLERVFGRERSSAE